MNSKSESDRVLFYCQHLHPMDNPNIYFMFGKILEVISLAFGGSGRAAERMKNKPFRLFLGNS